MERASDDIVWQPRTDAWATSALGRFARWLDEHGVVRATSYADLLDWSLRDLDAFWSNFAEWAGVRWHERPACALARADMPGAQWFPGGTLNYAEHALGGGDGRASAPAVIAQSQTRPRVELTWAQLTDQVARCRHGLERLGVGRGDRVVAYAPNIPETLIAFLATASLGAVWSSCAPEFGVRAVLDRWTQIEPSVLLVVGGYRYGARDVDRRAEVVQIRAGLPSLRATVEVPHPARVCADTVGWDELVADEAALEHVSVPVTHPLYVLYSSGTTGLPKPIVHGHGGIVVEHLKVLTLHHGLGPGARFAWMTTTGWMMWNYLVSGLLAGATIVLVDGDPSWPDRLTPWRIAADEQLDVAGLGAPFVTACAKDGLQPGATLDLSRLHQVGVTGSPLPPEGFRWITAAVGAHVQPVSISGGTDVCTAFVGGVPTLPVRAGEITARLLGCDVQALDPAGAQCPPGVTGELAVVQPMPSMPVGFWGDEDGNRYRDAYFARYPGRWHHGDWITFREDGACVISGRSDATLNRGGVRVGTAEYYRVVETFPEVADSLVVHVEDPSGGPGTLVLLVVPAPGHTLDEDLRTRLRRQVRDDLSPRHVPDVIDALAAIPRTLSGKKLEVPVKRMLLGADPEHVASRDSLADPGALDSLADWVRRYRAS